MRQGRQWHHSRAGQGGCTGLGLPRIVRFFETADCEGASCPHCGATGRYIHRFQVEDGRHLGAMSGCVQLFPVSPVAHEDLKLRKKETDHAKKGWKMASWDIDRREAIDAFYAGALDEQSAMSRLRAAAGRAKTWRMMKGRR